MSNDDDPKIGNVIPFDFAQNWKSSKSAEADHAGGQSPASLYDWMTDEKGKPVNNLSNALATLRHDPALNDAIIFDEMYQAACLVKVLPGSKDDPATFVQRPITDHDVTRVQEYMQHIGLTRMGKDLVHQAVDARAQECRVHPVRDWLESLTWDGVPRVSAWLTTYLGATAITYSERVGMMALIAMVARVMDPGCKVDHMLVLEGPQGVGKSTVCKILGGAYFSDTMPPVNGNKDAYIHLAGKWIIETPELYALENADGEKLKAFLSGTTDRFRPPYGRKEVKQPRQCVFIGTTNQNTYLKDPTGGRRFWPVRVGKIDMTALQADRDQLFAEAVMLYQAGASWHPDPAFEKQYIVPEQEDRFETDPWEPTIKEYLATAQPEKVYLSMLFETLHIEPSARVRTKQNRLTAILCRLGWQRHQKKDSKGNVWWAPPLT
jgi:predicted P-loop ATPase